MSILAQITELRKKYKALDTWCATENTSLFETFNAYSNRKKKYEEAIEQKRVWERELSSLSHRFAFEGDGEEDTQLHFEAESDVPF